MDGFNHSIDRVPLYTIYRDVPLGQPFDPSAPLIFLPPRDSDELHDALRLSFPHLHTHTERMRDAVLQFLLEERDAMTVTHPVSYADTWSLSPNAPLTDLSLVKTESRSPRISVSPMSSTETPTPGLKGKGKVLPGQTSSTHENLSQDDMTGVFSLSTNINPRHHTRRKMTELEKIEYRKRRIVKACEQCARRKRKCTHSQVEMTRMSELDGSASSSTAYPSLTTSSQGAQHCRMAASTGALDIRGMQLASDTSVKKGQNSADPSCEIMYSEPFMEVSSLPEARFFRQAPIAPDRDELTGESHYHTIPGWPEDRTDVKWPQSNQRELQTSHGFAELDWPYLSLPLDGGDKYDTSLDHRTINSGESQWSALAMLSCRTGNSPASQTLRAPPWRPYFSYQCRDGLNMSTAYGAHRFTPLHVQGYDRHADTFSAGSVANALPLAGALHRNPPAFAINNIHVHGDAHFHSAHDESAAQAQYRLLERLDDANNMPDHARRLDLRTLTNTPYGLDLHCPELEPTAGNGGAIAPESRSNAGVFGPLGDDEMRFLMFYVALTSTTIVVSRVTSAVLALTSALLHTIMAPDLRNSEVVKIGTAGRRTVDRRVCVCEIVV